MNLSPMDYIRAAIAQAQHEGLTLEDLYACAECAASTQAFCDAVNLLAGMKEEETE
jgi:hypothetical protein